MLTPKEKACQLYNDFFRITESGLDYADGRDRAKESALLCVEECLEVEMSKLTDDADQKFWQEVAKEIRNI